MKLYREEIMDTMVGSTIQGTTERGIGEKIFIPKNPQIIGALGAAVIAAGERG